MTPEEEQKDGPGTGFRALSSMVSDVDDAVASAKQEPSAPPSASTSAVSSQPEPQVQPAGGLKHNDQLHREAPQQPIRGSSTLKWLAGVGGVIGVLWLFSFGSVHKTTPPTSTIYPPVPPAPVVGTAPSPVRSQQDTARPLTPSRPSEEKPPVGIDLVHGPAQLRYCVAENIRREAAKRALNNYVHSDVDRFNAMVADYNSRCGQFRYRRGTLESARTEVERRRPTLEAEGRSRFSRSPTPGTQQSTTQATGPQPDPIVRAVQSRLNELGYAAGVADGIIGPKTRAAIAAFQRAQGIPVDGVVSEYLLERLKSTPLSSFGEPAHRSRHTVEGPASSTSKEPMFQAREPSSNIGNLRRCLDGRYPALCNHALLTPSEATQVDVAERRANLEKCIDGRYPSLCDHSLLTSDQAVRVGVAERKANFATCIDGRYPSLCNHSLLTSDQAVRVGVAERKANFATCIDGRYPSLCNHSLLTPEQATRVGEAEVRAARR